MSEQPGRRSRPALDLVCLLLESTTAQLRRIGYHIDRETLQRITAVADTVALEPEHRDDWYPWVSTITAEVLGLATLPSLRPIGQPRSTYRPTDSNEQLSHGRG